MASTDELLEEVGMAVLVVREPGWQGFVPSASSREQAGKWDVMSDTGAVPVISWSSCLGTQVQTLRHMLSTKEGTGCLREPKEMRQSQSDQLMPVT